MIKKLFYIFIISISLLFINCSNNETANKEDIRQELTYELFNQILSDTTDAYIRSSCLMGIPMVMPHFAAFSRELDLVMHILNEEDSVNILEQFKQRKDFKIDSLKIKNMNILPENYFKRNNITRDSLWNYVDENCSKNYVILSMPIFKKRQFISIYTSWFSLWRFMRGW